VRVLALIHEEGPCSGVIAEAAAARRHEIDEWSLAWGEPAPRPLDEYAAVLVFGGVMHADQEQFHPWLREENMLIQRLLDQHVPLLGVCLGGQLIARAAHAPVTPAAEPEIGWTDVRLTAAAEHDPVLSGLPAVLKAFQWHHYRFELPAGAEPLAESRVCLQAFRLGELAWGLQFHCEVTREMILDWTAVHDANPSADRTGFEPERIRAETERYVESWNEVGRQIGSRFLGVAERVAGHHLSRV